MTKDNQDRSVTIRIKKELYQELVDLAISKSVKEGRVVKVSEIIREKLEN
jgi:hypothetical protein